MFCPHCGASGLPEDAVFCADCGQSILQPEAATDPAVAQQPDPYATNYAPVAQPRKGVPGALKAAGGVLAALTVAGGGYLAANQFSGDSTDAVVSSPSPVATQAQAAPKPTSTGTGTSAPTTAPTTAAATPATGSSSTAAPAPTVTVTKEAEPAPTHTVIIEKQAAPAPERTVIVEKEKAPAPASDTAQEVKNATGSWETVSISDFRLDLPAGYSARVYNDSKDQKLVMVKDEAGKIRARLSATKGPESQFRSTTMPCSNPRPYTTVGIEDMPQFPKAPDAKQVNNTPGGKVYPRTVYRVIQVTGSQTQHAATLAVTDHTAGVDNMSCGLSFGNGIYLDGPGVNLDFVAGEDYVVDGHPAPQLLFSSKAEADGWLNTDEYRKLEKMLASLNYTGS